MKIIFLVFGAALQLLASPFDEINPSSADEIASLNADLIVDGFVSAMSGQLVLSEIDLHVKGVRYCYDRASQLISEEGKFYFAYDKSYNRILENGQVIQIDPINQRTDAAYDLNGNLLRNGFIYDEFDQLVQTGTEHFTYDALGRRLANGSTSYFYIEDEEIGSFQDGQIEELKIGGTKAPIAIEIRHKPFASVVDTQNTIRQLIDWNTGKIAFENSCDPFGKGLSGNIPYAYVGKRYDTNSGLVYFGKRFYDPLLGRWLTPDPLGSLDHSNLYQYVFNNPFRYYDPNGESLAGYLLGLGELVLGGTIIAGGLALEVVTLGGFTFGLGLTTSTGAALMGLGLATTTYHAQDIKMFPFFSENAHIPFSTWKEATKKPPRFNGKELGCDPAQCPGEGFEWRGKGAPESGKGNWLNPATGEKLHPDLWHPEPKGPHWGYQDSDGISYDLYPNGKWQ